MSAVIVGALALVVYTYAGYPLLMAFASRRARRREARTESWEPMVSVLMSVHDAHARIALKLENLLALDWPADRLEILVYSDGSRDGTDEVIRRWSARDSRIRWIHSAQRRGKPHALNELAKLASGTVLLLTDVRPLLDRGAVRALVAKLADPEVACVSGNLMLAGDAGSGAYWRYEKLIRSSEAQSGGLVGVTGAVYAIRRSDFPLLPEDVILDDMWVPLSVALTTKRRIELADDARAYDDAFEDDREFDRKARTLAGNFQLLQKLPILLDPVRNPLWFRLVSHKLLRLVCPWALGTVLVLSGAATLSGSAPLWLFVLFAGQIGFYALALLGTRGGRLGRLSRSFVVLNAAAVVGFWRFARGTQRVTW